MNPIIEERFVRLIQRIEPSARLLRVEELTGGVSARVSALEIERADGTREKLVVRQHGPVDLTHNPNVAGDEFRLLQILQAEGIPAPHPIYVDSDGAILGSPGIVVSFIKGSSGAAPDDPDALVDQLAALLRQIHAVGTMKHDLSFLPRQSDECARRLASPPEQPDDELGEERIRATLAAVWPLPPRNRSVLLHGDFWPGNTLWVDGRLTGVIDWEDASTGDPLADLANTRLEIQLAHGSDAMHRFTSHYLTLNPVDTTDLPYWDLCAALRPIAGLPGWGLDATTLRHTRAELKTFIDQAFEAIGSH